jgi:hypothetical protein
MLVKCPNCEGKCTVTPTGQHRYETEYAINLILVCPELQSRLKEKGSLAGTDSYCQIIDAAADQAFEDWSQQNPEAPA